MKKFLPAHITLPLGAILVSLVFASAVHAITPSGIPTTSAQPTGASLSGMQKACQAREAALKTRSASLTRLAATMEEKFDAIAQRVITYYTSIVLPSGKTVRNYSTLVSDIAAKKLAVQTALTKAQKDVSGFSCMASDPKGQMRLFRLDMQDVKQKLQDYRTSIKNLIVAVHSVTGEENKEATNSGNASRSGKPVILPESNR